MEFPGEVYGMVMNLEEDNVGAVLLGSQKNISEGDTVKTTGRVVEVPVGDALFGTCRKRTWSADRWQGADPDRQIPSDRTCGIRRNHKKEL